MRFAHGSTVVVEFEASFHELARHATYILTMEYDRVQCLVRGLRLPLCMSTESFATTSMSFAMVFVHS